MPKKDIVPKKPHFAKAPRGKEEEAKKPVPKIDYIFAIGRRKTAIANVKMAKGSGKILLMIKKKIRLIVFTPNR